MAVMTRLNPDHSSDIRALANRVSALEDAVSMVPTKVTTIPSGGNLDVYGTDYVGSRMRCDSGSIANTLSNTPYKTTGFTLIVVPYNESIGWCAQVIVTNNFAAAPYVFMRTYVNGVWTAWRRFTGAAV